MSALYLYLHVAQRLTWVSWVEEGLHDQVPNHVSWSALPSGGFYTLPTSPVRPPRPFTIDVPPPLLCRLKGYGLSRRFYHNLPLSSFRTRSSGPMYALTPVGRLPRELILEIITYATVRRTLEDDSYNSNEIHAVQSMALVCLTWMSVVASNQTLWGRVMASAGTSKQRFIIQLLAGHSALDLVAFGTQHPRHFKPYILTARTLNILTIGEEWAQFVGSRYLPALRMLSFKRKMPPQTPRWVEIDAPNLEHLCINRRVTFISPVNLRSLRLLPGFVTGSADDVAACRALLGHSRNTLEELQIDDSRYDDRRHSGFSWHTVLECLNGGPLQELRIMDNAETGVLDEIPENGLSFPNLRNYITANILRFEEPPALERADVFVEDFAHLHTMLDSFMNTRILEVTFNARSKLGHYLYLLRPNLLLQGRDNIIFHNLRSLVGRSFIDLNIVQLLCVSNFPHLSHMMIYVDIPLSDLETHLTSEQIDHESRDSEDSDDADVFVDVPWGTCEHLGADPVRLADRIQALEFVHGCFDNILRGRTTLTIATRAHLAERTHHTTFSLVDENMSRIAGTMEEIRPVGLHICASLETNWCRCTMNSGYLVSAVHAFSAVAQIEVVRVRFTMDIVNLHDMHRHHGLFDTYAPDVLERGRAFAFWTPPDPLAAPDPQHFDVLCRDISRMRKVEELEVEVVRSCDRVGLSIFRALIHNHTNELAGVSSFCTFQKLNRLVISASQKRRSVRIAKRGSKFWEEIVQVAKLRHRLHDMARCPLLHIVLSDNFCSCQTPTRDEAHIHQLRSLATVSVESLKDGCVQCA